MNYKFTGKPDRIFPRLKTGEVYDLTILVIARYEEVSSGPFGWLVGMTRPVIVAPIQCPYRSWDTFYANWERDSI